MAGIERVRLYEERGEGIFLQADDGPVWGLYGPTGQHRFDFDAPEWINGGWSPDGDYMHAEWEVRPYKTRGLTLVAAWTRLWKLGIVLPIPGPAAANYLGVPGTDVYDDDET